MICMRSVVESLASLIARVPAVADARCGRMATSCPLPRSSLMALPQHFPCGLLLLIAYSLLLQTCRHSKPLPQKRPILPRLVPRLMQPLVASSPPIPFNPAYFVNIVFMGILQSRPSKLRLKRLGGCAYICS